MVPSPLRRDRVLAGMVEALPTHAKDDTTSDLSSSLDVLALLVHSAMTCLDFKLLLLNEDEKTAADCARLAPRLPPSWNLSPSSRGFVYSHNQSSMRFIINVSRLGTKIDIRGIATGDDRIARTDVAPRDFVNASNLPLRIPFADQADGTTAEDRGPALTSKIQSVLTPKDGNADTVTKLIELFDSDILRKLAPSISKEGYEESNPDDRAARQDADTAARSGARQPPPLTQNDPELARPTPYPVPHDSFLTPRPRPFPDFAPPGFEDEYEINRPPRFQPQGGHNPYSIGSGDLNPPGLGPHDPLRGSFVPPGGMPGLGPMGGMHPTFDEPLFQGPRGQGDPSFDPQIPPGARWDPLGPGGAPRFGGGRPGGRGGNAFGGGGGDGFF